MAESITGQTGALVLNDATWVEAKALSRCKSVTFQEEPPDSPTTNFLIAKPTSADTAITRTIGTSYTFTAQEGRGQTGWYSKGQSMGWMKLAAAGGTKTFQRDEKT